MVVLAGFYFLLRRIIRQALAGPAGRRTARTGKGVPASGGMMVRDAVCKTYITPASAISYRDPEGKLHYFCSEECRTEYIERRS